MTTGDNKLKANWSEAESIGNTLNAAGGTVGFNYCAGCSMTTGINCIQNG